MKHVVLLALVLVVVAATGYVALTFRPSTNEPATSSENACSLLTPDVITALAWNGAGHEVQGINQSASPWDEQSIQAHIEEGWQTLCQSQSFVSAIRAHGPSSFSSGGGFVNPSNEDASVVGIHVGWSQTADANCTAYQEGWLIYIVNGTTTSAPSSISTGQCTDANPPPL